MKIRKVVMSVVAVAGVMFLSCDKSEQGAANTDKPLIEVNEDGVTRAMLDNICPLFDRGCELLAEDEALLLDMRMQEKFVRDLYVHFANLYPNNRHFYNVSIAGGTRISLIESLLDFHGVQYAALGEAGTFADEGMQAYYDKLTAGVINVMDAALVMATIEEESVAFYMNVERDCVNNNVCLVASCLLKGSSNHLKAAVRQISNMGGTYEPVVLDRNTFDNIVSASFECCGRGCSHNKYCNGSGSGSGGSQGNKHQGGKHK